MLRKSCPHCFKRIPFRKLWKSHCPYCFKPLRQRSTMKERSIVGLWLEDRGTTFWFVIMAIIHVISAMILSANGNPTLLYFIDRHYIWFILTMIYIAGFASICSRIYFPLLLGAPGIIRRERHIIVQYKRLTAIGLLIGPFLSWGVIGYKNLFNMFPVTVFLGLLPVALMWSYLALAVTEEEYDDERIWSYLAELGASERLDHRHHGFMVLGTIPVAFVIFYFFVNNLWIAYSMRNSILVAMFKELWHAAKARGGF